MGNSIFQMLQHTSKFLRLQIEILAPLGLQIQACNAHGTLNTPPQHIHLDAGRFASALMEPFVQTNGRYVVHSNSSLVGLSSQSNPLADTEPPEMRLSPMESAWSPLFDHAEATIERSRRLVYRYDKVPSLNLISPPGGFGATRAKPGRLCRSRMMNPSSFGTWTRVPRYSIPPARGTNGNP